MEKDDLIEWSIGWTFGILTFIVIFSFLYASAPGCGGLIYYEGNESWEDASQRVAEWCNKYRAEKWNETPLGIIINIWND